MAIKEGSKLNEIVPGASVAAIIPTSFDDAVRFGRLFVSAGLYSVQKKAANDEKSSEELAAELHEAESQAAVIILYGMELGIPPLQALSGMALINGKPCIYGDLVPAILWSKGFDLEETVTGEGETLHAVVTVTRPNGKKITREYKASDAIEAGLWDTRKTVKRKVWKNGARVWDDVPNDAPWFRQRKRMVQMRARGFACRDGASDVLRGMYLKEEIDIDLDRSEYSEEAPKSAKPAAVALPPAEMIEDKPVAALPAPAEKPMTVELPKAEGNIYAQKVHVELPRAEPELAADSTRIDTPKQAADWAAKNESPKRRGRPPKAQQKPDPDPDQEEATPAEMIALYKAKFAAAKSVEDIDWISEEAKEVVDPFPLELKSEFHLARITAKFEVAGSLDELNAAFDEVEKSAPMLGIAKEVNAAYNARADILDIVI